MGSINRHVAEERVALVVDTAVGAQGLNDGIKKHIAEIRKAVGVAPPEVNQSEAFLRKFGKGI